MVDLYNELLIFLFPAMLGGFLRAVAEIGKNFKKKDGLDLSYVFFTIFASMLIGGVAGIIVGASWKISIIVGFAGSEFFTFIYKTHLLAKYKKF